MAKETGQRLAITDLGSGRSFMQMRKQKCRLARMFSLFS